MCPPLPGTMFMSHNTMKGSTLVVGQIKYSPVTLEYVRTSSQFLGRSEIEIRGLVYKLF